MTINGKAAIVDPGGETERIRDSLFPLGDHITLIPGPGPTSTFGREGQFNLFVADGQ